MYTSGSLDSTKRESLRTRLCCDMNINGLLPWHRKTFLILKILTFLVENILTLKQGHFGRVLAPARWNPLYMHSWSSDVVCVVHHCTLTSWSFNEHMGLAL